MSVHKTQFCFHCVVAITLYPIDKSRCPADGQFRPRVISDDIRLHRFRFSFAQAPPLSRDVLFTQSSIYRPARIFQKWTYIYIRKENKPIPQTYRFCHTLPKPKMNVECLVNKVSHIPDVNCGFIRHIVTQNKVRFGSTFVQKDNSNVCTKFLKYVGNHNRLCEKKLNCHKLMINHRLSYKQALQII